MDFITSDFIQRLSANFFPDDLHPSIYFHPSSIGYIRVLLTPYVTALKNADSVKIIQEWVQAVFPQKYSDLILHRIQISILKVSDIIKSPIIYPDTLADIHQFLIATANTHDFVNYELLDTHPVALLRVKTSIIKYLVEQIIQVSGNILFDPTDPIALFDTTVLPWDINDALSQDPELSKIFGVTNEKALPVTVTISNNTFTHMLTNEFTVGLLLFSVVTTQNFHITLFGHNFDTINNVVSRYSFDPNSITHQYSIIIGDNTYAFNTTDFIQGFTTGALWLNTDPHLFCHTLLSYSQHNNEITSIPLTF